MNKINSYALRLLGRREYSVFELKEKLDKSFPDKEKEISLILEKFQEKNWLSDRRYCEVFIKDKIIKKQGPIKIKIKLSDKGVDSELIDKSLNEFYKKDEQIKIVKYLGEKKKKQILKRKPKIPDYELNGKIKQFLFGRGFVYEILEDF